MEHKNLNIILNNGVIVMISLNITTYIGLALIIFGGCLYFLAVYMIKKYEDKLRKEYTFEIVRPRIKTKSNRLDTKK